MSARYFTMTETGDVLAHYASLPIARLNRDIWNASAAVVGGQLARCDVFEEETLRRVGEDEQ